MQRINAQIQSDLVEPEIEKIRGVLKRAQKLAALKSVAGVALGGLVTTCGLLAGLPPPASAAAGLTTAAGVSGAAISARMDKLHEIAQNDMYFIWKALHAD
jgi:outer membrane lipoprotein SlyB